MPTARNAAGGTSGKKVAIPHADDLKKQWNQAVCGPTGKAGLDAALAVCPLQ
jgi:hypothetical protein